MRTAVAAALLAVMTLGAHVAATTQQPVTVEMRDYAFAPRDTIVPPGTTVLWVNLDDTPHQIAMTGGRPGSSAPIDPGKEYAFTFGDTGQFTYRCAIHPTMLGVVIVQGP